MNLKHGYQLGGRFIDWLLAKIVSGGTHDPVAAFTESHDAWNRGDFPVLCLTSSYLGGTCHTVRPYKWVTDPAQTGNPNIWLIKIANPNFPPPIGDDDPVNQIEINHTDNTFRFAMSQTETWTGGTWTGGRLFTAPFSLLNSRP